MVSHLVIIIIHWSLNPQKFSFLPRGHFTLFLQNLLNLLPHRFNFHGNSDHYTSRYSNLKPCFWYLSGAFTFCPMVFRSLPSTPIQDKIQKHLCHTYAPIAILKDSGRQTLLSPQTLEGRSRSLLCLWEALISTNLSPLFWRLQQSSYLQPLSNSSRNPIFSAPDKPHPIFAKPTNLEPQQN